MIVLKLFFAIIMISLGIYYVHCREDTTGAVWIVGAALVIFTLL